MSITFEKLLPRLKVQTKLMLQTLDAIDSSARKLELPATTLETLALILTDWVAQHASSITDNWPSIVRRMLPQLKELAASDTQEPNYGLEQFAEQDAPKFEVVIYDYGAIGWTGRDDVFVLNMLVFEPRKPTVTRTVCDLSFLAGALHKLFSKEAADGVQGPAGAAPTPGDGQ